MGRGEKTALKQKRIELLLAVRLKNHIIKDNFYMLLFSLWENCVIKNMFQHHSSSWLSKQDKPNIFYGKYRNYHHSNAATQPSENSEIVTSDAADSYWTERQPLKFCEKEKNNDKLSPDHVWSLIRPLFSLVMWMQMVLQPQPGLKTGLMHRF